MCLTPYSHPSALETILPVYPCYDRRPPFLTLHENLRTALFSRLVRHAIATEDMILDFFCMIVVYRPTREFAIHMETSCTVTGEGLQILTYARHSWPLSCEGSLKYHTYCYTGHPFIMVISEDP